MKCLIFSDSHGNSHALESAIAHHPDAEVVFFLGDGIREAESVSLCDKGKAWFFVLGNCDFKTDVLGDKIKKTDKIVLFGRKIVFTHGDLYGVKFGNDGIRNLAASESADVVLFGHTHTPCERYVNIDGRGVYFFNPGTISGANNNRRTYGIMDIEENVILFSHGTV